MVPSELNKPVYIWKLVLINDLMPQKIDMIHGLSQIDEWPTVKAYIFRSLQLIIEREKSCKIMIIVCTFAHSMTEFELY